MTKLSNVNKITPSLAVEVIAKTKDLSFHRFSGLVVYAIPDDY